MVELYKKEGKGVVSSSIKCIYVGSKNKRYIKQKGEYVHIVKRKGEYVIANENKIKGGNDEDILIFQNFFNNNNKISKKDIELSKHASSSNKQPAEYFAKKYVNEPEMLAFLIYIKQETPSLLIDSALEIYTKYVKFKYEKIIEKLRDDFMQKQQRREKNIQEKKNKLFQNEAFSKLYLNGDISSNASSGNIQKSSYW
jgi:hypothetical protein